MMLNLTSIKQVRPVITEFFLRYPDAHAASWADQDKLAILLKSLGLYNRRAKLIIQFSREYNGDWDDIRTLPGIGKYAEDSYRMFVQGSLDIEPMDSKLKKYKEWALNETGSTVH